MPGCIAAHSRDAPVEGSCRLPKAQVLIDKYQVSHEEIKRAVPVLAGRGSAEGHYGTVEQTEDCRSRRPIFAGCESVEGHYGAAVDGARGRSSHRRNSNRYPPLLARRSYFRRHINRPHHPPQFRKRLRQRRSSPHRRRSNRRVPNASVSHARSGPLKCGRCRPFS
jgi:hypothetical protein